ncbi:MAG TPA: ribose-5-phosphate isomerase RpiA [Methanoculleus sp.]|nr:ribose-5-phosphate isomerase RpiA [Methanoculleus sp.]
MDEQARAKRNAGYYAADLIEDDAIVGLGTGSTVFYMMDRLAGRMREGLRATGIATSFQTERRAYEYRIPLSTLHEYDVIDIAIDGADQIDPAFRLIKGRGAAQTRERCVAEAADAFVVVADKGKLTDALTAPVPVEVLSFAVPVVMNRLAALGGTPVIREGVKKDGPVITDNGNWIIDCRFPRIDEPERLEDAINTLPGVLSCGIFTEFTGKTSIVVGTPEGVEYLSL